MKKVGATKQNEQGLLYLIVIVIGRVIPIAEDIQNITMTLVEAREKIFAAVKAKRHECSSRINVADVLHFYSSSSSKGVRNIDYILKAPLKVERLADRRCGKEGKGRIIDNSNVIGSGGKWDAQIKERGGQSYLEDALVHIRH